MTKDFKTLESCHRDNHFILPLNNYKVNRTNIQFVLQSYLSGMSTCTHMIGQSSLLLDDSEYMSEPTILALIEINEPAGFSSSFVDVQDSRSLSLI